MKTTILEAEYLEIEALVNKAITAYTKAEASPYINRLEFISRQYSGRVRDILSKLISSTTMASGQTAEKERWLYFCKQDLVQLSWEIQREK